MRLPYSNPLLPFSHGLTVSDIFTYLMKKSNTIFKNEYFFVGRIFDGGRGMNSEKLHPEPKNLTQPDQREFSGIPGSGNTLPVVL
jgi:hypothetical protein